MHQIHLALFSLLAACAEGDPEGAEEIVLDEDAAVTNPPDY
jgi:hypothetical protein